MNNNHNNNVQGAGQQDYLDKAFAAGAKKFGGAQGQKIANNRGMSEKIVRGLSLRHTYSSNVNRPTECVESMRRSLERRLIQSTRTREHLLIPVTASPVMIMLLYISHVSS